MPKEESSALEVSVFAQSSVSLLDPDYFYPSLLILYVHQYSLRAFRCKYSS
jgi:hypothetical protein